MGELFEWTSVNPMRGRKKSMIVINPLENILPWEILRVCFSVDCAVAFVRKESKQEGNRS